MTLKQARKKAGGITQKELAEMMGVTKQTIYNWESGFISPTIIMAKKIGEVLGMVWYEIEYPIK